METTIKLTKLAQYFFLALIFSVNPGAQTQQSTSQNIPAGTAAYEKFRLSYVSLRHLVPKIYDSLKPGGRVIVEAAHRDATKNRPIGGGVVFDTNELLMLFSKFRILHYEDTIGPGDFGGQEQTRLVRLCAQKQ